MGGFSGCRDNGPGGGGGNIRWGIGRGQLFGRGSCLGGNCPGGDSPEGAMGGICLLGVIDLGVIVFGSYCLGGGNCPGGICRGELSRGQLSRGNCPDTRQHLSITTQYRILTLSSYLAVENIVRKGEIACFKQSLLFSAFSTPCGIFFFTLNALRLPFVSVWTNLKFCRLVMD